MIFFFEIKNKKTYLGKYIFLHFELPLSAIVNNLQHQPIFLILATNYSSAIVPSLVGANFYRQAGGRI